VALDLAPTGSTTRSANRPSRSAYRISAARATPEIEESVSRRMPTTTFMTLLAPNTVGGLSLRTPLGRMDRRAGRRRRLLVNSGELLRRWTNDRFMATPHRGIKPHGVERYALSRSSSTRPTTTDGMPANLQERGQSAEVRAVSYQEYQVQFQRLNYDTFASETRSHPKPPDAVCASVDGGFNSEPPSMPATGKPR
jgi:hypothetical protein